MCPNCRAFITTSDRKCPYCEVEIGPRAIDRRTPDAIAGGLIPHARFLTVLILTINAGLYAATMLSSMGGPGERSPFSDIDGSTLIAFGAKDAPRIFLAGEWWRLVTAGFLHAGLMHIVMNTWVLFDLAASVEELFGATRMTVIYFVSTVLGFYASCWWRPYSLSVGASAGAFGLLGAMIAFGMMHRGAMGDMIKTHYSRWAVYGILIGILGPFRMDNAAHIGGMLGGFLVARLAGLPTLTAAREPVWSALAWISAGLTGLSFAAMAMHLLGGK
jgi:rhomboid protease GluP